MTDTPKRRWRVWLAAAAMAGVVAGGWWLAKLLWFRPANIDHFFERVFIEYGLRDPELLSQLRFLEGFGLRFHNDDLTPASPGYERERLEMAKRSLALLRAYPRERLSEQQQLSVDILEWFLRNTAEGEPFLFHTYPVNQLEGVQNALPNFMVTIHQVHDATDAEHYITRLSKFPWKLGQVLDGLHLREEHGILPPRFVVERVLTEMRAFIAAPPEANVLATSFREKLDATAALSPAERQRFAGAAEAAVAESVYPAYRELIAYCERLESVAGTDDGAWHLPDGDAFYAYALRTQTTTSLTPEEVHQLGLSEVERILGEMRAILESVGYGDRSVGEAMAALGREDRFRYADDREGRAQCLEDYQKIIDEIAAGLDAAFDVRPASGVRVERVPEFKEAGAPGAYYDMPAMDGSRPGIFYANLRDMAEVPRFGMRTLAYHEAIPGHHFQFAIQQELRGVPTFRRVLPFTAFMEGWALYAERVAWELGFQDDPFDNLGRLRAELFRAVRLVVDTGIHYKRWTREQAIEYMETTTGMAHGDVVAEIERYIVSPGQACAYKIGQLKILELRERARVALGEDFDFREFHNVVLTSGALPLEILERRVEAYIAEARKRSAGGNQAA